MNNRLAESRLSAGLEKKLATHRASQLASYLYIDSGIAKSLFGLQHVGVDAKAVENALEFFCRAGVKPYLPSPFSVLTIAQR